MMPRWSPKSAGRLLVNPGGHEGVVDRHATEADKREKCVSCMGRGERVRMRGRPTEKGGERYKANGVRVSHTEG